MAKGDHEFKVAPAGSTFGGYARPRVQIGFEPGQIKSITALAKANNRSFAAEVRALVSSALAVSHSPECGLRNGVFQCFCSTSGAPPLDDETPLQRARAYLAFNAAESGADVVIADLIEYAEELLPHSPDCGIYNGRFAPGRCTCSARKQD